MDRRHFIRSLALLAPAALAAERRYRIGILMLPAERTVGHFVAAFKAGMSELGYREGMTVDYVVAYADGRGDRLPDLARGLLAEQPDLIVAASSQVTAIARAATSTLPIVMATGSDPVAFGLAASLARPGGNVTGVSNVSERLMPKMVELLRSLRPAMRRIGVVVNPDSPALRTVVPVVIDSAERLGLRPIVAKTADAAALAAAADGLRDGGAEGLVIVLDPVLFHLRAQVVALADALRLPAIYPTRDFVVAGGLMSYGSNIGAGFRYAARYVDRILRGAAPGELPIEDPAVFELVVSRRAAQALNLHLPRELLARADELID